MKQVYEWALRQAGATKAMLNAVNMLPNDHAERFVEVVLGCEMKDEDIPKEFIYEGKLYKFVRSNYVRDEIVYSCEDSTTKYFSTQEDADKYAKNGDYNYNRSSNSPKDEYPFEAVWTRECEHTTWYSRWFDMSNEKN